jgi:hypothetical protein
VAQSFDVPKGDFAARDGEASKKADCNMQLFRTVLGKGLMYAGSAGVWLKKLLLL